jgi:RHS repeat-associated protein
MDPDGSVWFTQSASNQIGHLTPTGILTEWDNTAGSSSPHGIVRGPDGNYWFCEGSDIGKINPATGQISQYPLLTQYGGAQQITVGPDNNMWFTETHDTIGKITTAGTITEYQIDGGGLTNLPAGITAGPDGRLWFTETKSHMIGNITTSGAVTEYTLPSTTVLGGGITAGPDGKIWFTEDIPAPGGAGIARMEPSSGLYVHFKAPGTYLDQITPDNAGGLVFTSYGGVGRIDMAGNVAMVSAPWGGGVTVSPDNAVWYTSVQNNSVERVAPNYFTLAPSEFYGESNPAEPGCTYCLSGDPVNVASGNLTESATDLAIPARGVPFGFSRTYNALDAATAPSSGPLGWGWTFGDNASLSVNGSGGAVTVRNGNGSTVQFVPNKTGYSAAARVIATLVHNGDLTYTYTLPDQTADLFSSIGVLTGLIDRNGYTTTLTYTGGKLTGISDPSGRTITIGWTGTHVTSVTSPLGRLWQYGYDGSGNLATVTTPESRVTTYGYDAQHRLTTTTLPRGGTIVQALYDSNNRVKSQTNQRSLTTLYAYAIGQTTVTDPAGHVTVYLFDDAMRITSVTRGFGTAQAATTSYTYDNAGNRLTMTIDPLGLQHTTVYTYNSAADMLTVTDPLQHTNTYTYNTRHEVLTAKDPLGVTTTNVYDDATGNMMSTSRPLVGPPDYTQQTVFHYDDPVDPGDVTSITDPDYKVWTYGYNNHGDQTSVTDPLGDKTTASYNADGQQVTSVSARGYVTGCGCAGSYTTQYTYWPDGQTHTVTDPLGHVTTSTYDGDGNLSSQVDADGNSTGFGYDLADELLTTTRADGTTLQYTYDAAGNKASYTDGLNHQTTYLYDPLNRLKKTTAPGSQITTYVYDAASNLSTVTDPANQVTTYGYDNANRNTTIGYSDGTTHGVIYTYDADGQRKTMVDAGTTTYTVDSLHRLSKVVRGAVTVIYGYNLRNLLGSITYATGKQVTYTYDDAGRATSVTDWLGGTTTLTPDPDGNTTSIVTPTSDNVTATYTYNKADQLKTITDAQGPTTLATFVYNPDPAGLLQSLTTSGTPQGNETYTYTKLNQLKTVNTGSYSYDAGDNPTGLASGATQTFHNADTLCWTNPTTVSNPSCGSPPATATSYIYNSRGDRTTATTTGQPTTTYGYDQPNRLTSYTKGATTASYSYDGDGLRTSKTLNGGTPTPFTWGTIGGMPQLLYDGTTYLIYTPDGTTIEQITAGTPAYLHTDRIGSIRLITAGGATTGAYAYDAYGKPTGHTGTATSPLQYAGQYLDTETGLYYLRARYYDPATAQFLTMDPAVELTQSAYGYVSSNPLNSTDPSGQVPCGPTSHMYWLGACDSETEAISKQLPFSATQFIFLSLLPLFPAGIFAEAEEGACAAEAAETGTVAGEQATIHGAERLTQAGFDEATVSATRAGRVLQQADGATVYVNEVSPGKYDFIIQGERGVVTAHRGWSFKAVTRLAGNYGWKGWP